MVRKHDITGDDPGLASATFHAAIPFEPTNHALASHNKSTVHYFQHPDVPNFHYGERHPMKPHRLALTTHLVLAYGLHEHMDMYAPREATREELEAFHAPDYIDFLSRVSPSTLSSFSSSFSRYNIGDDCPIFDGMYDFCRLYAGSSIEAARHLTSQATDIAINWSGGLHHAKKAEASGFCYVNDIVLACLELLRYHPRVLYVDIDIHHGDGVQEAFFTTDRVMTVSFHKYNGDFFPGTGPMEDVGLGDGKHYALNVPLNDGVDDAQYVYLFKSVMEGVMQSYRPAALVLQCGADSLGCDRLGVFNLSIQAHGECVRFMKDFGLPTIVVGGGGYTIRNVSRCWAYETSIILGRRVPDALPPTVYHEFFAPDYRLHPRLSGRIENHNTFESIERLRIGALERLRYLNGAPSVQMQEVPRLSRDNDLDEEKIARKERQEDRGGEGMREYGGGEAEQGSALDGDGGWYDNGRDQDAEESGMEIEV